MSDAPALADGAELIGLGRSIYAVFDRKLVAHALESIRQRLQRGAAHPSAQFVTATRGGQLLRAQMAPVRTGTDENAEISGFVLMLDNITRDFAEESQRDRLLHGLAEGNRASLGNLQAALEMLEYPDLDEPTRERFLGVIRDEARGMATRLNELASHSTQTQKTRWPLEDMLGADLVAAAQRRIEALYDCRIAATEIDATLWLRVDSFSLLQALTFLAGRLVEDYDISTLQLRLAAVSGRAHLDLLWIGQAMSTETVIGWETEPMKVGADSMSLSVRDVVERHGGEFWFERERARQAAFFRFLLPLADERAELDASLFVRSDSRPEYYDFDLFKASEPAREWAERRLVDLSYTVFDTETTGLQPVAGRRDHPDRRRPHRQRQAAAPGVLRATGRSAAADSRGVDPDPRHPARDGGRPADARRRCCRRSTRSRRTPCWSRTTRPSTCASCNSRRRRPASSSTSRCSTRCCCRPWCTRIRIRTVWRPSPNGWTCR